MGIFGCFLLAFAGVILVVFNGAFVLQLNPLGDLLSFGAALCWAIYSVLLKKYGNGYSSITLNRKLMLYGLLTALPILLGEGNPMQWSGLLEMPMLFNLLFLGIVGSGICLIFLLDLTFFVTFFTKNTLLIGDKSYIILKIKPIK